jgi:hypothetical protein
MFAVKVGGQFGATRFRKIAVLLGVLIVVAFATIQTVHAHPENGLAENPHCAICAAVHVRAVVAIPVVAIPALFFACLTSVLFEPPLRGVMVLDSFFGRAPPSIA